MLGAIAANRRRAGSVFPIAVEAVGSTTAVAGGFTTVTYPGGIQAGEYLELTAVCTNITAGTTIDTPSGWTLVFQDHSPSNTCVLAVFSKVAAGGESGTVAMSATGTIAGKSVSVIIRYSGVDSGTPSEQLTSHTETSGPDLNGNAITTGGADRLVVNKYVSNSAMSMTAGSGWLEDYDALLGGAGPDVFSGGTHKEVAAAGSVAAEAATHSTGSPVEYFSFTYALIP